MYIHPYPTNLPLKNYLQQQQTTTTTQIETKKSLKKLFEEKYKSQTAKSDKKALGVGYFFQKLRF